MGKNNKSSVFVLTPEIIKEMNIDGDICFSRNKKGGCNALEFGSNDIENGCCEKCRFRMTLDDWIAKENKKKYGKIKRFELIFDGRTIGTYSTIEEMDNWLKKYWEANKKDEFIPRYCENKDYNVLFATHNVVFKYEKEGTENDCY